MTRSTPTKAGNTAARDEYMDDFIQRAKTVADQNKILRARAPSRIKTANQLKANARSSRGAKKSTTGTDLAQYHAVQRLLEEKAFYPPHDKRIESPAYAKVHKQMTVTEDQPCLVCGVRHSTLSDRSKNPFGAVQMETHHHIIEWALANAIVPKSFNTHVRPGLARRAADRKPPIDPIFKEFDPLYARDMNAKEIRDWVDHSPDNLWVLCDVHHRHKFVGIHAITYPIWGPQDLVDAKIVASMVGLSKQKLVKKATTKKVAAKAA